MFRQPFLAPALGFTFLVLPLQAGLLVEPAALELPEQPFARQLLFRNLQGLFDVIVEDLDFHGTESSTVAGGRASHTRDGRSSSLEAAVVDATTPHWRCKYHYPA